MWTTALPALTSKVLGIVLGLAVFPGLFPGLFLASPARAQVEGLSYSLTPSIEHVRWDADLGLDDATLYGARLGFRFGRTMALEGFYLTNGEVETSIDTGLFGAGSASPTVLRGDVDLERYGVDLILNLSRGRTVPYLDVGGSIFRLDPSGSPGVEEIGLQIGGGVRYAFSPRLSGRLFVQNARFRADRARLHPEVDPKAVDPEADDFRSHLVFGAGVDVLLGGYSSAGETEFDRALRARYQAGLLGASWPVEPFVGSLRFDDGSGLSNQDFVGLRTGIDIGSYLGLRGFYWRGVKSGFDDTEPTQSFGGELQFNLNSGPGVSPYLIGGVGYLDFLDGFRDQAGEKRDDETVLIAGGGLRFGLGRRFVVDLSARDYLFSQRGLDDVRSAEDLSDNWAYSVGMVFQMGGSAGTTEGRGPVTDPIRGTEGLSPQTQGSGATATGDSGTGDSATDVAAGAAAGAGAGAASGSSVPSAAAADSSAAQWTFDATRVGAAGGEGAKGETLSLEGRRYAFAPERDYRAEQTLVLPVPKQGEIYVRYGDPGGVEIQSWFEGRGAGAAMAEDSGRAAPGWESMLRNIVREELSTRDGADAKSSATESGAAAAEGSEAAVSETRDPAIEATTSGAAATGTPSSSMDANELRDALRQLEERLGQRIDERIRERDSAVREDAGTVRSQGAVGQTAGSGAAQDRAGGSSDNGDPPARAEATIEINEAPLVDELSPDPEDPGYLEGDRRPGAWSLDAVQPHMGFAIDDPGAFVLGGRAVLGRIAPRVPLRLVPEANVGMGDNATYLFALNLRWLWGGDESSAMWRPYAYAGAGVLGFDSAESGFDRSNGVVNVGYGVERRLGRFMVFAEHQGVDVFEYNRLLVGVSGFGR